jgi:anaphase-promoting complex subunit 6
MQVRNLFSSKYKEAFEQYKKSNQLRPESGSTYTALGFTKHIMGETEVAIEYYHKALGLDPDDAIAEVYHRLHLRLIMW